MLVGPSCLSMFSFASFECVTGVARNAQQDDRPDLSKVSNGVVGLALTV